MSGTARVVLFSMFPLTVIEPAADVWPRTVSISPVLVIPPSSTVAAPRCISPAFDTLPVTFMVPPDVMFVVEFVYPVKLLLTTILAPSLLSALIVKSA